jgi:DNA-binding transcriptional LysR family regulator
MINVDLGLVRVFLAVYETGSVSAAADRLNVTQPSVSHAISRLRDVFRSPLFVRTGRGMEPTAVATGLYPAFRSGTDIIRSAIGEVLDFDPSQSRRVYRIAMTDLGEIAFLPPIMMALAEKAPGVSIEVASLQIDHVVEWLIKGRVDVAICPARPALSKLKFERIFYERYQCIYRRDHPRLAGKIELLEYLGETHIAVDEATGHGSIEAVWRENDISPRVGLRLPSLGVAESIVAATDCIAVVPSRIAKSFEQLGRIRTAELPLSAPQFEVGLHWWDHGHASSEAIWFRSFLKETLCSL